VGWLRRTGWILAGLLGLLSLLAAAGAVYNAAATARDQRRFPPPGRLVDVEGLRLHLDCRGQGDPTVVFESGLGDPALAWALVQPEVARFTRACSYDRAGAGYSDEPRYDRARDGRALVGDLHALLSAAGVTGPYVLVGHSFGGLLVRLFAATFPAEAVGVVLVDAGHEDQQAYLKARVPTAYRAPTLRRALRLGLKVNRFGILRLRPAEAGLDPSAPMYRRLPSTTLQAFTFLKLQTKALRANLAEFDTDTLEETLTQVRAAGTLGDRPLVVLSAGVVAGDLSPADAEAYRRLWLGELQPALARLSTRGRLVVVHDSGHRIPFERPDAVIEAVRAVVGEARQ
jgi:pimeloyl-ACP methyl ester carboxylesterase